MNGTVSGRKTLEILFFHPFVSFQLTFSQVQSKYTRSAISRRRRCNRVGTCSFLTTAFGMHGSLQLFLRSHMATFRKTPDSKKNGSSTSLSRGKNLMQIQLNRNKKKTLSLLAASSPGGGSPEGGPFWWLSGADSKSKIHYRFSFLHPEFQWKRKCFLYYICIGEELFILPQGNCCKWESWLTRGKHRFICH